MKCDEGRPSCSACDESGLLCGGYEKNIFFNCEDNNSSGGAVRFRRPMLTQEERQHMSECLTSSIPPKSALRSILEIDDECENSSLSADLQVYRGPFGAFKLSQPCGVLSDMSEDEAGGFLELGHESPHDSSTADVTMSPTTQQLLQSILDDVQSDQRPSFIPQPCRDMTRDTGRIREIFDDAAVPDSQEMPSITNSAPQYYQFQQFMPHSVSPVTSISIIPCFSNSVPQDAVLLLQHYSTTVLNSLTPFRHTKTPWHILFIPHTKNCLAALTLGEQLDHASLSMFYGTLAVSAFSLGGISQSQIWLEQAQAYKQLAREHTRSMLKTAYDVPKVSKYKSILMALVTMVQVSIFSENRDQTECYFLEAERFIRLRGLNRPKSRKVRLLHHLYAYERILHESTVASAIDSNHRYHVRKAVESSGLVILGQDSLSFGLPSWKNFLQEMSTVKNQLDGENDLHLERPGIWPATLYPEVFGVPESWLFAMSLVVRLGREKDAAEKGNVPSPLSLKDFLSRAQTIEKMINQLQWPSHIEDGLEPLLTAMQTSLQIHFYRRIYDVDASMLQNKVRDVRDCLLRYEHAEPSQMHASARFIWPALIAARECEDPEVQISFSMWFKSCALRSGFVVFTNTLGLVSQAWEDRRRAVGNGLDGTD